MTDRSKHLFVGSLFFVAGLLIAGEVYWLPGQLEAPAWVVYAAASTFSLAGLSIGARALSLRAATNWLTVLVVAALVLVALWMAFGAGPRPCTISVGFLSWRGPELLCRGTLGFCAVIATAILIWIVVRGLRRDDAGGSPGNP